MQESIKPGIFILLLLLVIGNSFAQKSFSAERTGNCQIETNSNYSIQGKIMWNGDCENGYAHGNGIIWVKRKKRVRYVGNVSKGDLHGYGVYYGTNHHSYAGEWSYGNFTKGDIFFLEIKLTNWYDTECIYGGMRLRSNGVLSKNGQVIDTSMYKLNVGIDTIYPGAKTKRNKAYFIKTKAKYIFKAWYKTIKRETMFDRGSGEHSQGYIIECNNGKIGAIIEEHKEEGVSWVFNCMEKSTYNSLAEAINGFCDCSNP